LNWAATKRAAFFMQKKAVVGKSTLLPSLFFGGTNGKKIKIQRISECSQKRKGYFQGSAAKDHT
jgi:predicted nucleotidyltransferase